MPLDLHYPPKHRYRSRTPTSWQWHSPMASTLQKLLTNGLRNMTRSSGSQPGFQIPNQIQQSWYATEQVRSMDPPRNKFKLNLISHSCCKSLNPESFLMFCPGTQLGSDRVCLLYLATQTIYSSSVAPKRPFCYYRDCFHKTAFSLFLFTISDLSDGALQCLSPCSHRVTEQNIQESLRPDKQTLRRSRF